MSDDGSVRSGTCPQCGGIQVAHGLMKNVATSGFLPGPRRFLSLSLREGVRPDSWDFQACLRCGHLWGRIDPEELRRFILRRCTRQTRPKWRLSEKSQDQSRDDLA
ncbi:MAG TPA: hypothetical protein VFT74_04060 [Isosphaeraceae bacterium]|nr:hypothetical protein [Isosphaeraceae bacterium]